MPGPVLGPCGSAWISAAELAEVCSGADPASPVVARAAVEATQILYELSGRQFQGSCTATVRPCRDACACWGGDVAAGGYSWLWLSPVGSFGWGNNAGDTCGCGYISRVKLADYPVTEILEVKIDGVAVPLVYPDGAPTYRLDKWRFLTRMDNPAYPAVAQVWPLCQDLSLPDSEPGTFSISYSYGVAPPSLGMDAARQLGCQLSLALSGKPCQLPAGATTITKQGTTVNRGLLGKWGYDRQNGWQTGLVMVDAFLSAYNGAGLRRRPAILSPDLGRYAQRLGGQ